MHLKSHVKYKSDAKQPKASRGGGLCKIALGNTTHVSDKASCNCQTRLLSEISVTVRTFAETGKKWIGFLNQGVENAGVAFVKRNELFEKINKHDEQVRTNKAKD